MTDEAPQSDTAQTEQEVTSAPKGKPAMVVKVYAPFKVYYEGEGYSLSAVNATGPFDVLPHHHKFLCMLVPCSLTIETPAGQKVIKVNRALMHVKSEHVTVFMDV